MLNSKRQKPKSLKRVGGYFYYLNMKTLKNIEGLTELNKCEQSKISGGESFWYHLGYALGKTYTFISDALDSPARLQSATVYK